MTGPIDPKKQARRVAAWKSQRIGKSWENILRHACRVQLVELVRIPDGCRQVGPRLVRVKSPFDWIMASPPIEIGDAAAGCYSAHVDTKTITGAKLARCDLPQHQLEDLVRLNRASVTGFLVWFRPSDRVVFFDAQVALLRTSIPMEEGLDIGTVDDMDLLKLWRGA